MRGLVLSAALLAGVGGLAFAFRGDVPPLARYLGGSLAQTSADAQTPAAPRTGPCPTDPLAPAVTPTLAIPSTPDSSGFAARYGALQYPRGAIAPMQIALSFDDGPDAINHTRVLDILDKHCLKASFFFVGELAAADGMLTTSGACSGIDGARYAMVILDIGAILRD